MNGRLLARGAAGLALLTVIGFSLTLIPAAGASPISHATAVTQGPVSLGPSVHPAATNATCTITATLTAIPAPVYVGQGLTLVTALLFHKSAPSAVCASPAGFVYSNLPVGCPYIPAPTLHCTARGAGVFVSTVHVYFPLTILTASTTVVVLAP